MKTTTTATSAQYAAYNVMKNQSFCYQTYYSHFIILDGMHDKFSNLKKKSACLHEIVIIVILIVGIKGVFFPLNTNRSRILL